MEAAMLTLLKGHDNMDPRVSAALTLVERAEPAAGALLREVVTDLQSSLTALEENRIETHMVRSLTRTTMQLSAISSDAVTVVHTAQNIIDKLTPVHERLLVLEEGRQRDAVQGDEIAKLKLNQNHEARIKELEAETTRAASREKLLLAAIPVLATLASALTYWITGTTS